MRVPEAECVCQCANDTVADHLQLVWVIKLSTKHALNRAAGLLVCKASPGRQSGAGSSVGFLYLFIYLFYLLLLLLVL